MAATLDIQKHASAQVDDLVTKALRQGFEREKGLLTLLEQARPYVLQASGKSLPARGLVREIDDALLAASGSC
jgi:hypothetical protein